MFLKKDYSVIAVGDRKIRAMRERERQKQRDTDSWKGEDKSIIQKRNEHHLECRNIGVDQRLEFIGSSPQLDVGEERWPKTRISL